LLYIFIVTIAVTINTIGELHMADLATQKQEVYDYVNTFLGGVTGNLTGSVVTDDSEPMVDAVNYALFSDTLSLTPLNEALANPVNGMIAGPDGAGWDPAGNAKNTLVAYLGSAWVTVAAAAAYRIGN
jgi:hypothetical protein